MGKQDKDRWKPAKPTTKAITNTTGKSHSVGVATTTTTTTEDKTLDALRKAASAGIKAGQQTANIKPVKTTTATTTRTTSSNKPSVTTTTTNKPPASKAPEKTTEAASSKKQTTGKTGEVDLHDFIAAVQAAEATQKSNNSAGKAAVSPGETNSRAAFVNRIMERECRPVTDVELWTAKKESSLLPGLNRRSQFGAYLYQQAGQAQDRYGWLQVLQEKQKKDREALQQGGTAKGILLPRTDMSDEEKEAYVFSPQSGYSQWMLRQLNDTSLSAWEKADLLETKGYTPMQAQTLMAYMDDPMESLQITMAITDKNQFTRMQAGWADAAEEHPVASSLVSIPLNVMGGMGSTLEDLRYAFSPQKNNPYSVMKMAPAAAQTIRRTVGGKIDNDGLRFLYDAGMFVGDAALSYALGKMAFYDAGAVAPLTQKELQLAEYANDVASMAGEYGKIAVTASGELSIDPVAEMFLTGYTSNVSPQEYQIAFDFFRGEGKAGMDFETAATLAEGAGLGISREAAFMAHCSGVNEANAAKSLTESGFSDRINYNFIKDFSIKINAGKQGKHIIDHNNYIKGRSVFQGSLDDSQNMINEWAGTGQWIGQNKERVNFGQVIGRYVDPITGEEIDTTVGIIHYSKTGTHIIPARPTK